MGGTRTHRADMRPASWRLRGGGRRFREEGWREGIGGKKQKKGKKSPGDVPPARWLLGWRRGGSCDSGCWGQRGGRLAGRQRGGHQHPVRSGEELGVRVCECDSQAPRGNRTARDRRGLHAPTVCSRPKRWGRFITCREGEGGLHGPPLAALCHVLLWLSSRYTLTAR